MKTWRIDQTTTYYDSFVVVAETQEDAARLHREGKSKQLGGDYAESEIVDITVKEEE